MSRRLLTVYVTTHAIERWRERVDAAQGAGEIIAALRAATPLDKGEPLPFTRWPNTRYYRHAEKPEMYFVTEPRDFDSEAVVTVIDTTRLPPRERKESGAEWPGPWVRPRGRDLGERRAWLFDRHAESQVRLAGHVGKRNPVRKAWAKRVSELELAIAELNAIERAERATLERLHAVGCVSSVS